MSDDLKAPPAEENGGTGASVLTDYVGVGVGISNVLIADLVGASTTLGKVLLLCVPFVTHGSQRVLNWWQLKAETKRRFAEEAALTKQIQETISAALADPANSPEFKERLRKKAEGLTEARLEALIDEAVAKGIVRLTQSARANTNAKQASGAEARGVQA